MPGLPVGRIAAALAAMLSVTAGAASAAPAVDVLGYQVALTPDLGTGHVEGRETIRVRSLVDGLEGFRVALGGHRLEAVQVDGVPARVVDLDGVGVIELPAPLSKGRTATISLRFSGKPARGLVATAAGLHTSYFTCAWMVCEQEAVADPSRFGDLASLDLTLAAPHGVQVAATGRPAGSRAAAGRTAHRFRLERPVAPFLFGWAVGDFRRVRLPGAGPELVVLGEGASPDELTRMFGETRRMLDFFEAKAGVRFPYPRYTQVVAARGSAQEAAGMAFFGIADVRPMLSDPQEDWAVAHELAHQWWGVTVAAEDLSHFWLNEGLAVFMTAAWKEHRWGRAAYEREMALARRRWQAAQNRPIAYAGAYPTLAARRAIVYSKAALFLDALRADMGERAFWRGIGLYTRRHAGRTANSADFQRAMERAAGRTLQPLFDAWVYDSPGKRNP